MSDKDSYNTLNLIEDLKFLGFTTQECELFIAKINNGDTEYLFDELDRKAPIDTSINFNWSIRKIKDFSEKMDKIILVKRRIRAYIFDCVTKKMISDFNNRNSR